MAGDRPPDKTVAAKRAGDRTAPTRGNRTAPPRGEVTEPALPSGPVMLSRPSLTREHDGRYETAQELGRGGIGRVLLSFDQHLSRHVAVKELLPELTGDGETALDPEEREAVEARFLDEARITGQLEHPSIVSVHELGRRADGSIYYTMGLVRGQTLSEALKGRTLRQRLERLANFLDLCHAVDYAHSRGVLHRDLKPANVMLGEFGETVVLDWGLAKVKGEPDQSEPSRDAERGQIRQTSDFETVVGVALGTPAYMPPEQARGDLDAVDERSDVYCLGAILYQILTGRAPHTGETTAALMEATERDEVIPPRRLEPEVPTELADIALRALRYDKAERYPSARLLADDIRSFQVGGLVRAHSYSVWDLVRRWIRRHRLVLGVGAAMVVIGLGAWFYRGHRAREAAREAARRHRARVASQVQGILRDTARGSALKNWLDLYTFKLIALKHPVTERLLIGALAHKKAEVRRLVARSLGGMGSRRAVAGLCARLNKGVEPSESVVIEVINALGLIGDSRAEDPVSRARFRYGQFGNLWWSTELAYRMIPLPREPARGLDANALTDRGRALVNKGRPKEALKLYERAIRLNPRLGRAHNNRANLLKRQGRFQEALKAYTRAIALDSDHVAHYYNRAMLRRRLEQYRDALADLDRAVKLEPRSALALTGRARLHHEQGRYDAALADYQAVLKIKPGRVSALLSLGRLFKERGDDVRALATFDGALTKHPRSIRVLRARAALRLLRGELDAARIDVDRILGLDPADAPGRALRARIRLVRGDVKGAREDLDRAVGLNPRQPRPRVLRAVLFFARRGRFGPALVDLNHALKLTRFSRYNDAWYRFQLLAVAQRAGQPATGLAVVRRIPLTRLGPWPARVARHLLGLDRKPLLPAVPPGMMDRRCAALHYQGLRAELDGRKDAAVRHYREALRTRKNRLQEYVLAAGALRALGGSQAPTALPPGQPE